MIIVRKKPFYIGLGLLSVVAVVFYFLLTPVIPQEEGEKLTGLQYSDKVFNQLSKGSSNFIHLAAQAADNMLETSISPRFRLAEGKLAPLQKQFLLNTGAQDVVWQNGELFFEGDLGLLLEHATEDAQLLYFNHGEALSKRYGGASPLEIAKAWWGLLTPLARNLELTKRIAESKAVNVVLKRALEPGNNYYGIPYLNITQNIPLISGFLLFYIVFTVCYGFAIYEIFNGLGFMENAEEVEEREEMSC